MPATFERVMDNVLRKLNNTLVYVDDIIVYTTSLQEHLIHVDKICKRLRKNNFMIQLDKSELSTKEVACLPRTCCNTKCSQAKSREN